MPVTPFHFGPGLLIKAAAPRRFSFAAYAAAQVVIDVESGYNILFDRWPFHRLMHTFVIGSAAGAAAGIAVGVFGARVLAAHAALRKPIAASEIALVPATVGGLVGGALHVLLDGIQHEDMHPFWPFSDANPLLGIASLGVLELGCVVTGVIGIAILARRLRRDRRGQLLE